MRAVYRRSYSYQPVSQTEPADDSEVSLSRSLDSTVSALLLRSLSVPDDIQMADNYDERPPGPGHADDQTRLEFLDVRHQETGSVTRNRQGGSSRRSHKMRCGAKFFLGFSFVCWIVYFAFGFPQVQEKILAGPPGSQVPNGPEHQKTYSGSQESLSMRIPEPSRPEHQETYSGSQESLSMRIPEPSSCYIKHNETGLTEDVMNYVFSEKECAIYRPEDKKETGILDVKCCHTQTGCKIEYRLKVECMCTNRIKPCIKKLLQNKYLSECDNAIICRNGGQPRWNKRGVSSLDEIACNCEGTGYTGKFCHVPERLLCSPCSENQKCQVKNMTLCSASRREEHYPCQYTYANTTYSCRPHKGSKDKSDLGSMRSCKDFRVTGSATTSQNPVARTTTSVDMTTSEATTVQVPCQEQVLSLQAQVDKLISKKKIETEMIRKEETETKLLILHWIGGMSQLVLLVSNCICVFGLPCCVPKCVQRRCPIPSWILNLIITLLSHVSLGFTCFEFGVKFQFLNTDLIYNALVLVAASVTPLTCVFLHPRSSSTKDQREGSEDGSLEMVRLNPS